MPQSRVRLPSPAPTLQEAAGVGMKRACSGISLLGSMSWALGLLVGINMLFLGLSLVMTVLAARAIGSR
jgi:hypothetical protein